MALANIKQIDHTHIFQAPIGTQMTLLPGFFTALKALEEQFPDLLKP